LRLKAGIIGASGIGLVHARIYNEIGIDLVAILSSSKSRAIKISSELNTNLNLNVKPFYIINDFLKENLDLISICSSPKLHYNHIISSLNCNLPIFCEKPFLDISKLSSKQIFSQLKKIKNHKNRFIYVNTCNTVFADSILNYKNNKDFKKIRFEFFTNGPYQYEHIGYDLLPHAFSIITHLLKESEIENFCFDITKNKFKCNFSYGSTIVDFDLREDINGPKHMLFNFDENEYIREQSGKGKSYSVSLIHSNLNRRIICEDPFKVYIKNFKNSVVQKSSTDKYESAELILKLTSNTFTKINQSSNGI
tara:strand:- start:1553 stop:2476 length:924 start_codon:yes stop_codon:yes gene_type:complete